MAPRLNPSMRFCEPCSFCLTQVVALHGRGVNMATTKRRGGLQENLSKENFSFGPQSDFWGICLGHNSPFDWRE